MVNYQEDKTTVSLLAILTVVLSSSALLLSNQSALPTVTSLIPFSPTIVQTARADMNIDTSGNGKAAAFDSKNSIPSDGKGFCNTVDNIAAGINELNPKGSCNRAYITIDAAGISTVITKDFVLVIVAQEEYLELLNL